MNFEEEVRAIVKKYEAPKDIENELIDFLIHTRNAYNIVEAGNRYWQNILKG